VEYDGLTDYASAGRRRLADARELLEVPTWQSLGRDARHRHLRAAVYLAGYAVECALKARMIDRTPGCRRFGEVLDARPPHRAPTSLAGAGLHSMAALVRVSDPMGAVDSRPDLKVLIGICCRWRARDRYAPRHFTSVTDARVFVDAAERVADWVNGRRLAPEDEA